MTQKEYKRLRLGSSQNAIIYRMLVAASGGWVLGDDMSRAAHSMAVSSRIRELREMGIPVEFNRQTNDRAAYRLKREGGRHVHA